ncbi:RHS repeat-associated core domain-containing protein, partial [Candidatus Parcubacteria bacterium]
TGLNYNYQRTYDPSLGRYTQTDPIGLNGGMNPFGYVNGDPVTGIDPFGLDWLYNRNTRTLTHVSATGVPGKSWIGISGPWGKGMLPKGRYALPGAPVKVPPSHPRQASFCDPLGNCWWQPIKPLFPTDRSGLGIHPDGNKPGTAGCIGIKARDTSDLFEALTRDHGPLTVR